MGSHILETLKERGLLYQVSETGFAEACQKPLSVYCGFDPTAPSLHLGNMVPVMTLAHFQGHGHRPIIVLGGGTGMIGDPSGKSAERVLMTTEALHENAERFRTQFSRFLSFEGPGGAIMVNNADWLASLKMIDFLRDVGKHFTVNAMIAKDSVRARLEEREQGISYTEFSYMLLQAYDFLHLYEHHDCSVQVGGSDQWGNITAGIELIRRKAGGSAHCVTSPLLTTATGAKFGKSEGNAVWLDPDMTSPYEMFQYWVNTDDRDARRFLTIFTFLPLAEIDALAAAAEQDPGARIMQRRLATEFVAFVHGAAMARAVERAAGILFGAEADGLDEPALEQVLRAVPVKAVGAQAFAGGIPAGRAMVEAGLAPSLGAARKLAQQGGLYVNNRRWSDPQAPVTSEHLLLGRAVLLRSGRKNYAALTV